MIETRRLILRAWRPSDCETFAELHRDPVVMRYFPKWLSREESDDLIRQYQAAFAQGLPAVWAVEIKATGCFAGAVGLTHDVSRFDFSPSTGIGWRLHHAYWHQGIAREAAQACLHHGFTHLALKTIVAFTSVQNRASVALMRRLGMRHVKTFAHPDIQSDHWLSTHALYQIDRYVVQPASGLKASAL